MIVRRANKKFLEQFSELSVRFFVKDKKENYLLEGIATSDEGELTRCTYEIGESAVDFLYDSLFDQVVGFLEGSEEIVAKIKQGDDTDKQWEYFTLFAEVIYLGGDMHPYYYPVFAEVVNAYKRNMRDQDGNLIDDDYFARKGIELRQVRQHVTNVLQLLDEVEDVRGITKTYKEGIFTKSIRLKNLQAEMIPMMIDEHEEQNIVLLVQKPQSVLEMWDYLLTAFASSSVRFKRCENCKRFFATTGRGNPKFCERIIEGQGRSCRQVMPRLMFSTKGDRDPAVWLYNKAYKTMYSRIATGALSKEMFHVWAKKSRAKRDECSRGEISLEDYSAWLCDNGLFRDYLKENK